MVMECTSSSSLCYDAVAEKDRWMMRIRSDFINNTEACFMDVLRFALCKELVVLD